MSYTPTQQDIEILYQNAVNIYIQINLLDKDLKIIDNLQGELISDSFTIDADSDIRRTFDLDMFVKDSSFLIGDTSKIWINKYITIELGLKNQRSGEIFYYPMGTYLFNEIGYNYDPSTKTLSLSCVDLMAQFTGLRNGQVMGQLTEITEGSNIRNSIIETLTELGNYNKYRIDDRDKPREGIINLFDIENSNNVYDNCGVQKVDYDTFELVATLPEDETIASIEYYNMSEFTAGSAYTFAFTTESDVSESKIVLIIYGTKPNSSDTQTIESANGAKILNFTIDAAFTKLDHFEIRIANITRDTNEGGDTGDSEDGEEGGDEEKPQPTIEIVYQNILIYAGTYTTTNLPQFVPYDRSQIVPHDLKFSAGATVYEILSELNDLEYGWEMFFDTDNTFINQKIPTGIDDPYVLDWETLSNLIISESMETNFSDVKNSTRVWGKCLEADRTTEECTNNGSTYQITVEHLIPAGNTDIPYGTTIAFKVNIDNLDKMQLRVQDPQANIRVEDEETGEVTYETFDETYPIVDSGDIAIQAGEMLKDNIYVVKYRSKKFYLQGQFQVLYVVKEYNELPLAEGQTKEEWIAADQEKEGTKNIKYIINSESTAITDDMTEAEIREYYNPFAIDEIGEIRQVLSGGDYDTIYTDELARERAEYENWKSMRLNVTLNIDMKPVLWLDVNQKIQYKSKITGKIEEYLVKSISGSCMEGKVSVTAAKFYPLYPFVVEDEDSNQTLRPVS